MTPQELTALKLKFYDALVRDPKLSAMDLRIAWLLLSRYLNAGSLVAWPSAETLARDLGSSVRGVRDSIQRLTAPGGWFKIEQGGGRGRSNVYAANFEKVNPASPFQAETVNSTSPFGRARGDKLVIPDGETVNARSLKGELAFRERVNPASPKSLLREPFEEPFEGGRARGEKTSHAVTLKTNHARQGDRGGRAIGSQGTFMLPLQGGKQPPRKQASAPDWNGWADWLQTNQGMAKDAAWSWLMATLERIERERGVDSTKAGAILDRELKLRRKAVA